jgi:hydroxyacylglutathione hydrolase
MVRLLGPLHVVAGEKLSHPWDANAFLVAGGEPTLIDCGSTEGYAGLKAALWELGYGPSDIRRVLVTHGHWDHASGMARLREESNAELFVHAGDREAVETGDHELTAAFLYGQPFPPLEVDGLLCDGQTIRAGAVELHVYHTPGHTPGSVTFWTEVFGMRLLFTGDAVWGAFHPRIRSSLDDWERSLDRILELDFDAIGIGHGPPALIMDARRNVQEARQQFGVYFNPWFKPFYLRPPTLTGGSNGHAHPPGRGRLPLQANPGRGLVLDHRVGQA